MVLRRCYEEACRLTHSPAPMAAAVVAWVPAARCRLIEPHQSQQLQPLRALVAALPSPLQMAPAEASC